MEKIEKKICTKCGEEKGFDKMTRGYNIGRDGIRKKYYKSLCKQCHNKQREERRKKNGISESRRIAQQEKGKRYYANNEDRKLYTRDYSLSKYGITLEDYDIMLKEQNYSCKICGCSEKEEYEKYKRSLAVDHCHITNKVRGILCTDCNVSLGKMKDNPILLRKAADYLEK